MYLAITLSSLDILINTHILGNNLTDRNKTNILIILGTKMRKAIDYVVETKQKGNVMKKKKLDIQTHTIIVTW